MAHRRTASRAHLAEDGKEPLLHARTQSATSDVDASSVRLPTRRRARVLIISLVLGLTFWALLAIVGPDAYATAEDWRDRARDQANRWRSKLPSAHPDRPTRPPPLSPASDRAWQQRWRDQLLLPVPEDEEAERLDLRDDLVTIDEVDEHRYTVVWLHGAEKFADEDGEWVRTRWAPYFKHTRWLIPQAPYGRYDIASEERTRWYNIHSLDALQPTECLEPPYPCDLPDDAQAPEPYTTPEDALNEGQISVERYEGACSRAFFGRICGRSVCMDEPGMIRSAQAINALLCDPEVVGSVPRSRTFVFGLSQGGVMSLLLGLTSDEPLAGFIAISGYLPLRRKIRALATNNVNVPYAIIHGDADLTIPFNLGRASFEYMRDRMGWHRGVGKAISGMGHYVGNRAAADALNFIGDTFPDARALAPGSDRADVDAWRAALNHAAEEGFEVVV